jgi:hypothetical protein
LRRKIDSQGEEFYWLKKIMERHDRPFSHGHTFHTWPEALETSGEKWPPDSEGNGN